jgi:opacity protein-like surface antigen
MKNIVTMLCLIAMATAAFAQETQRTELIVKHEYDYKSFYAVRFGFWFPKDKEQSFAANNVSTAQIKEDINQSQAFGLDFHFRKEVSKPLSLDFALQIWYTTYEVNFEQITADPDNVLRNVDSWAVIIPITAGLSVAPLPDGPIQPYAMAGIGAYIGISGLQRTTYGDKTTHDKSIQKVAFGGYIGAGLDIFLTERFGISLAGKYTIVKFSEQMYTQQMDFTGLQLMLGFATAM